jgi:shikimate kinase
VGIDLWHLLQVHSLISIYCGESNFISPNLGKAVMLIFSIGPSAVGKTTTGHRYSKKYGNCTFVDLDDAVAQLNETDTAYPTVLKFGWEKFYQDCQSIVAECEANDTPDLLTLVDVGEGVLWKEVSKDWLSKYKKISLVASQKRFIRGQEEIDSQK